MMKHIVQNYLAFAVRGSFILSTNLFAIAEDSKIILHIAAQVQESLAYLWGIPGKEIQRRIITGGDVLIMDCFWISYA